MTITVIGAGRVGKTLARLARQAGHELGDVVCRSRRSALAAARFIGDGRALAANHAGLGTADLVLICTPDDRIAEAVALISASGSQVGHPVVLHVSGALDSEVLSPLREFGMSVGSCHPLQTFETASSAVKVLSSGFFCIEGERRAVLAARRLVRDMNARYFEIRTERKSLYHAAAVLASGGITALLSVSLDMLSRCGLPEAKARRVLLPLVNGTVANVGAIGPVRALTGPIRRGDAGTVKRNLESLTAVDHRAAELYRLLGELGLALAEGNGLDGKAIAKLRAALQKKR